MLLFCVNLLFFLFVRFSQVLSTRKRKVEAGEEDNQTVKIVLEVFDLLYINGKSLLRQTLRERRSLMHSAFKPAEGFFHFASGSDHVEDGDTAPIEAFLQVMNTMKYGNVYINL